MKYDLYKLEELLDYLETSIYKRIEAEKITEEIRKEILRRQIAFEELKKKVGNEK